MVENDTPGSPEAPVRPPVIESRILSDEEKVIFLKALCAEKEGNFEMARDLFIWLKDKENALRCSEQLSDARIKLSKDRDKTDNKNRQNIYLLAGFAVFFILAFILFLVSLNNHQRDATALPVKWLNQGNAELTGYPSWFLYDMNAQQIRTRAVIDEKMKMELMKTFPMRSDSANFVEFRQAVEKLAFQSVDLKDRNFWLLLMVSGLAAVVGVFIREILDLIRHHCYEKDLDFKNWWPWYFLRPIVGFMFGIVVVLFSGTELLFASGNDSSETYLIAIAIIAGISVEDVMLKIRRVSMVLFSNNPEPGSSHTIQGVQNDSGNETGEPCKTRSEKNKGNPDKENEAKG